MALAKVPRIIISKNTKKPLVYLKVDDKEFEIDPQTAKDVGEALFKAGCDVDFLKDSA